MEPIILVEEKDLMVLLMMQNKTGHTCLGVHFKSPILTDNQVWVPTTDVEKLKLIAKNIAKRLTGMSEQITNIIKEN